MRFRLVLATVAVACFSFWAGCSDDSEPAPTLQIKSFSPESGLPGTEITIQGTAFSGTLTGDVVKFNGIIAEVVAITGKKVIRAVVPEGATSGKISVETNGEVVESQNDFVVLTPSITSFSPAYAVPGASVVIQGNNFYAESGNVVKFNELAAVVTESSASQLTVTVPVGATTGKISVNVGGLEAISENDFEVLLDYPREGLVAFYPFIGNADDISGHNLHGVVSGATLTTDRFGNADHAFSFDGIDDFISMGNPELLQISNKITIALWVRSGPYGVLDNVLSKKEYTDATKQYGTGFTILENETAQPSLGYTIRVERLQTETAGIRFSKLVDFAEGEWMFMAFVLDGTKLRAFRNDVRTASYLADHQELFSAIGGDFVVGKDNTDSGREYKGNVDDLFIYNRALSDEEVMMLFNQTVTKH